MGFRRKTKTYRLVWEKGELEGLEVRIKSLSVGKMLELMAAAQSAQSGEGIEALFGPFAENLVEWNLEDEETGLPVSANLEGVKSQDLGFVMQVVMRWMSAMADVDTPLPGGSNSGGNSPEPPPGLAEASQSPPSSPEQT